MMRIVADANVLVSAALARSPQAPSVMIMEAALDDRIEPQRVCRDPDDDYLVALAKATRADVLVTGDDDLLAIEHGRAGVEVLTPRELTDRLG